MHSFTDLFRNLFPLSDPIHPFLSPLNLTRQTLHQPPRYRQAPHLDANALLRTIPQPYHCRSEPSFPISVRKHFFPVRRE